MVAKRTQTRRRDAKRAAPRAGPRIRSLTGAECEEIFTRNSVGRLAYTFHDRVDIVPLHYALDGEWLYGRTSVGAKLTVLEHNRWVAFGVDEIEGPFDWRSVVVHGAFYRLDADSSSASDRRTAVLLLRRLAPEAMTENDPVAFREVLFRIHIDDISGRASTTVRAPD